MFLEPNVGRLVVLISTVTLMLLVLEVVANRLKAKRSYLWVAALCLAMLFQGAAVTLTVVEVLQPYLPAQVVEQFPW